TPVPTNTIVVNASTNTPTTSSPNSDPATSAPTAQNSVSQPTPTVKVTAIAAEHVVRTPVIKRVQAPAAKSVVIGATALPKSGGLPFSAGGIAAVGLGIAGIGLMLRRRNV